MQVYIVCCLVCFILLLLWLGFDFLFVIYHLFNTYVFCVSLSFVAVFGFEIIYSNYLEKQSYLFFIEQYS